MILAIDTAASLCAACVYDDRAGRELGRAVRDIGKGHAEQLMAVIGEALANAGIDYPELTKIAVAVGPGSFTGIRVGIATARGLALALKIPAIGVTTLEALAFAARQNHGDITVMSAIDAGRDGLYVAIYDPFGKVAHTPAIADLDRAKAMLAEGTAIICGSAAKKIAEAAGLPDRASAPNEATADIGAYARIAALRDATDERPKPLYLRAPDAKPQAHAILARRSE